MQYSDKKLIHPVEQSIAFQSGCYVDIYEDYEGNIEDKIDEAYNNLNEPPFFSERFSPVSTEVDEEIIKGINFTRMMIKAYHKFMELMNEASNQNKVLIKRAGEDHFVPYLGLAIDPVTLHRALEMEYETGISIYRRFLHLISTGIAAPAITVPFHPILPMFESEFDLRFLIKTGIEFYIPLIKKYHKYIFDTLGERLYVVGFWFPECAYNSKVGEIVAEEFYAMVKREGLKKCQLIFMFDSGQSPEKDKDELSKRLNYLEIGKYKIWAMFRENYFSNWLCYSNPSIRKMLDKTLAKSNTDPRKNIAQYTWCHFFEFEALIHSRKSAVNFKNIIVKFFETQYLPLSPDAYLRRKLLKKYKSFNYEPAKCKVFENSSWTGATTSSNPAIWEGNDFTLTRWTGIKEIKEEIKNKETGEKEIIVRKVCDDDRRIARIELDSENNPIMEGKEIKIEERWVSQCWKIALNGVKFEVLNFVRGDEKKEKGGIFEILRKIAPEKENYREIFMNLLMEYQKIYFKDHYIYMMKELLKNKGSEEREIEEIERIFNLENIIKKTLNNNKLDKKEIVALGFGIRAYFFVMESMRSSAVHWENFDNQYVYQCSMCLTLALINLYYAYRLLDMNKEKKKTLQLLKDVLIDFENTYERYNLAQYEVSKKTFEKTIAPSIENAKYNVVSRAAKRVAANHLLGNPDVDFVSEEDRKINAYTDHVWNGELHRSNIEWEEPNFCFHMEF